MTETSPLEFPPLCDAVLDREMADRLLADLTTHAEVSQVMEKTAARVHVDPRTVSLPEAFARLLEGQTRALQVTYRFEGQEWIDTLMRTPAGLRLVRCQVQ